MYKIGDWVILLNKKTQRVLQVSKDETKVFLNTNDTPNSDNWWRVDQCVPWEPKVGEWCWFKDKYFVKVLKVVNGSEVHFRSLDGMYINDWSYLQYFEPFIGRLPTFLKEQK